MQFCIKGIMLKPTRVEGWPEERGGGKVTRRDCVTASRHRDRWSVRIEEQETGLTDGGTSGRCAVWLAHGMMVHNNWKGLGLSELRWHIKGGQTRVFASEGVLKYYGANNDFPLRRLDKCTPWERLLDEVQFEGNLILVSCESTNSTIDKQSELALNITERTTRSMMKCELHLKLRNKLRHFFPAQKKNSAKIVSSSFPNPKKTYWSNQRCIISVIRFI